MDEFEKEMKTCFLDEAKQLLEDAEQNFMTLEASSDDITVIENLFRLAHNLKGGARAVGFSEMAEFTHVLESLLLKLKNKEIQAQSSTVTLLLESNDHLQSFIDALRGDFDFKMDSSPILEKLHAQINGRQDPSESTKTEVPALEMPHPVDVISKDDSEANADLLNAAQHFEQIEAGEATPTPTTTNLETLIPIEAAPGIVEPKTPPAKQDSPASASKKQTATEDESIRVSLKRLEGLIDNVGELVILQTVLNQQKYHIQSPLIQRTVGQLAKITKDIQEISMSLRMVPLKQTFQKMQRIVRDTAQALGKEIQFITDGEQTEIDKTVVDLLGDPLVHLIRNAVDHGIDPAADRLKLGKPNAGTITLAAYHRGGQIVIEVRDDGRGLNPDKLRTIAIEKGIVQPHQSLTPQQCQELIFAPGFSTKAEVTEISGRGVGMDVVKTNIEKRLQGEIELESVIGKGTCVRIMLPLTLAIIDGMVVQSGTDRFVVPLTQVFESLRPPPDDMHFVSGLGEVLSLRGEHLPVFRLSHLIGKKPDSKGASGGIAIVVRSGEKPFCIVVDDILGQQQIVIKQLGGEIRELQGVSGGAILGDGRPALILDFSELVAHRVAGQKKRSVA